MLSALDSGSLKGASDYAYLGAAMDKGIERFFQGDLAILSLLGVLDTAENLFASALEVFSREKPPMDPEEAAKAFSLVVQTKCAIGLRSAKANNLEDAQVFARNMRATIGNLRANNNPDKESLRTLQKFFAQLATEGERERYENYMRASHSPDDDE